MKTVEWLEWIQNKCNEWFVIVCTILGLHRDSRVTVTVPSLSVSVSAESVNLLSVNFRFRPKVEAYFRHYFRLWPKVKYRFRLTFNPVWHVSSRSGEACLRTAVLSYFT